MLWTFDVNVILLETCRKLPGISYLRLRLEGVPEVKINKEVDDVANIEHINQFSIMSPRKWQTLPTHPYASTE